MEKIELTVLGLSVSPTSNNAYALILKEKDGPRRLPIIIGAFEAQAIALEMEGVLPPRPMTHDLLKNLLESVNAPLSEVFINDLNDGTFYAQLIFDSHGIELDARPSDAIAMAVRFNCPIFVRNEILDEAAVMPQGDENDESLADDMGLQNSETGTSKSTKEKAPKSLVERLNLQLENAIQEEDYEKAAKIRDEIKRILKSS